MVRNVGLFLATGEEENAIVKQSVDTAHDPRFRRYMVNVMAANGEGAAGGAPLVEEDNPTYGNLVGRVEHFAQMGTLVTDFLLIKPGALHKANGGYLLLDARRLLLSPFAWEALKRAIKAREIRIEQPMETAGPDLDPDARSRADPARHQGRAVRRSRALLPAGRPRSRLSASLQGAGRLRRYHQALLRERQRLRPR